MTERRAAELYIMAVEHLGSDKAQVRSGGLYALERLAQDNPAQRQTIVNIVCSYLRRPFSPTAPGSQPEPEVADGQKEPGTERATGTDGIGETWERERQVRLTAQRILTGHLRNDRAKDQWSTDSSNARFWTNIRLDLTGATLIDFYLIDGAMTDANFRRATFSGDVSFSGATFSGNAQFGGAAFSRDASFSGATFSRDARFGGAAFTGDALFGGAAFSGDASFPEAAFMGDALFGEAAFSRGAGFRRAAFGGDAEFRKATFAGDAGFDKATFSRGAWFGEAIFTGDAGFRKATFAGDAGFDKATFSRGASFGEVAFTGDVWFGQAAVSGDAWFSEATFSGGAEALHFEQARILSPGASHVWPTGWRLVDVDGGGYTVVRADDDGGS